MNESTGIVEKLREAFQARKRGPGTLPTKNLPSSDALHRKLRYDPESGKLFWQDQILDDPRSGRYAGKEAFTSTDSRGYKRGKIGGVNFLAHRVIWKMVHGFDPETIDHINGNKTDNRIENLRSCSVAENSRNYRKPPNSSSGYRGVYWVARDNSWAARISAKGKHSLGNFTTEVEAAQAYDRAARKLHGEFATLNFPEERFEP